MQTGCKQTQVIQSKVIAEIESAPAVKSLHWNEFEISMIKKYYGKKNTGAIAKAIGKSVQSIYNKAQALGLMRR